MLCERCVLLYSREDANFVVREFTLASDSTDELRQVVQCFFKGWPDYGVPQSPDIFIDFIELVDHYRQHSHDIQAPILVHCSAGIGRTGTFCAAHRALEMFADCEEMNLPVTVQALRNCRAKMVQNVSQYEFLHSALATALLRQADRQEPVATRDIIRTSRRVHWGDDTGGASIQTTPALIRRQSSSEVINQDRPPTSPVSHLVSSPTRLEPPTDSLSRSTQSLDMIDGRGETPATASASAAVHLHISPPPPYSVNDPAEPSLPATTSSQPDTHGTESNGPVKSPSELENDAESPSLADVVDKKMRLPESPVASSAAVAVPSADSATAAIDEARSLPPSLPPVAPSLQTEPVVQAVDTNKATAEPTSSNTKPSAAENPGAAGVSTPKSQADKLPAQGKPVETSFNAPDDVGHQERTTAVRDSPPVSPVNTNAAPPPAKKVPPPVAPKKAPPPVAPKKAPPPVAPKKKQGPPVKPKGSKPANTKPSLSSAAASSVTVAGDGSKTEPPHVMTTGVDPSQPKTLTVESSSSQAPPVAANTNSPPPEQHSFSIPDEPVNPIVKTPVVKRKPAAIPGDTVRPTRSVGKLNLSMWEQKSGGTGPPTKPAVTSPLTPKQATPAVKPKPPVTNTSTPPKQPTVASQSAKTPEPSKLPSVPSASIPAATPPMQQNEEKPVASVQALRSKWSSSVKPPPGSIKKVTTPTEDKAVPEWKRRAEEESEKRKKSEQERKEREVMEEKERAEKKAAEEKARIAEEEQRKRELAREKKRAALRNIEDLVEVPEVAMKFNTPVRHTPPSQRAATAAAFAAARNQPKINIREAMQTDINLTEDEKKVLGSGASVGRADTSDAGRQALIASLMGVGDDVVIRERRKLDTELTAEEKAVLEKHGGAEGGQDLIASLENV